MPPVRLKPDTTIVNVRLSPISFPCSPVDSGAAQQGIAVKHASDEMGGGRGGFFAAMKWKFAQQRVGEGATNFRKRVSVEEQERRTPMAGLEEFKRFQKTQLARAALFPFLRDRRVSF